MSTSEQSNTEHPNSPVPAHDSDGGVRPAAQQSSHQQGSQQRGSPAQVQESAQGHAPAPSNDSAQAAHAPYPQNTAATAGPRAPLAPPAATATPAGPAPVGGDKKKLSTFLKVSIILLSALTVASIALVFIGDFDGKFERVFSTFLLFALFVVLTALDTSRQQRSEWYSPVALIANAYILGLLLIVIWMTEYDPFWLGWEIFWKSLLVVAVVRVVILGAQLLLMLGHRLPEMVTRFAFVTSVLGVLSGILFTAPVGISAFDITIPELYWKISTATLILTALGLAITMLLRWAFRSEIRDQKRALRDEQRAALFGAQMSGAQVSGAQMSGTEAYSASASQQSAATQSALPQAQQASQQPELLPWPTFADGTPLPSGPDGQPDFSVLNQR